MNAIAILEPTRLPIPTDVAKKCDLSQTQWRVLTDQIFPAAKTVEAVVMAIEYCRSRKLDIMKRPVHIVPVWSSAKGRMVETVWPGISEIRTTAARTGQYVGMEEIQYGPQITRAFTGVVEKWENKQKVQQTVTKDVTFPEWGSVVIYRLIDGKPRAFHTKIYWLETYGTLKGTDIPNDMWAKRPIGQFDKCLEAAALRKTFPEEVGNDLVAEEMEGRTIDGDATERTAPQPPKPPAPPKPPTDKVVDAEVFDAETGEITVDAVAGGVDADQAAEPFDATVYFERLEEALAGAMDEATVAEVWTEFDPEATFQGDDINRAIADKIRARRLKQIGG